MEQQSQKVATLDRTEAGEFLAEELDRLGVDITTKEGRDEFRETFSWATKQRRRCEKAVGYTILITMGGVMTAVGGAFITGVGKWISGQQ